MARSPVLGLPYVSSQQAQPEVTHNDSLNLLAMLTYGVRSLGDNAPPGSPAEGDLYVLGGAPTGAWSGKADKIAGFFGGAWSFLPGLDSDGSDIPIGPDHEGLRVYVQDEDRGYVWSGSTWIEQTAASVASNVLDDSGIQGSPGGNVAGALVLLLSLLQGLDAADIGFSAISPGSDVSEALLDLMSGKVAVTGDDMTGDLNLFGEPGVAITVTVAGDGANGTNQVQRFQDTSNGATYRLQKGRGSRTVPTNVATNDQIGSVNFQGYADGAFRDAARFRVDCIEAAPAAGAMGSRFLVLVTPAGSAASSEIMRYDHAAGIGAFGNNIFLTPNRGIRFRGLTLAAANALSGNTLGDTYLASDAGGANGLITHDGTRFRRMQETGTNKRATDAAFTLTPITSSPQQWCTGTLTADRAITLSTTGAYDGCTFRITRTGGGAFNYTVAYGSGGGSTKNIATNGWAEFVYDEASGYWDLAAAGSL